MSNLNLYAKDEDMPMWQELDRYGDRSAMVRDAVRAHLERLRRGDEATTITLQPGWFPGDGMPHARVKKPMAFVGRKVAEVVRDETFQRVTCTGYQKRGGGFVISRTVEPPDADVKTVQVFNVPQGQGLLAYLSQSITCQCFRDLCVAMEAALGLTE